MSSAAGPAPEGKPLGEAQLRGLVTELVVEALHTGCDVRERVRTTLQEQGVSMISDAELFAIIGKVESMLFDD